MTKKELENRILSLESEIEKLKLLFSKQQPVYIYPPTTYPLRPWGSPPYGTVEGKEQNYGGVFKFKQNTAYTGPRS